MANIPGNCLDNFCYKFLGFRCDGHYSMVLRKTFPCLSQYLGITGTNVLRTPKTQTTKQPALDFDDACLACSSHETNVISDGAGDSHTNLGTLS